MKDTIYCYIGNYHICKRIKAFNDRYHDILKPCPILISSWTDVILDFEMELLLSNSYNMVLIMIDRLTKEKHYISCTTEQNGITTEATAYLLSNNDWKLHGFFLLLSLDGSPQFISEVWKNLCKIFGIKINLSIAFHPKTNR